MKRRILLKTNLSFFIGFMGIAVAVAVLIATERVQATLGEGEVTVASDGQMLSSRGISITTRIGYTVHEIVSDAATVREYVSRDGWIFAIAWNGLIHPDLTQLLGAYATEYEDALQRHPPEPGQRVLHVEANNVIVEKWGQMRNLQGRAYVPALIPPGVTVDEIR
jgi:hypothetical protein